MLQILQILQYLPEEMEAQAQLVSRVKGLSCLLPFSGKELLKLASSLS
jgi:hypothetical protein